MSKGSNWRKSTDYKKYWDSDFWKKDKTTSDKPLRMTYMKTVILKDEQVKRICLPSHEVK